MLLYYIFNTDLLSKRANVQMVLKTCEALLRQGVDAHLVVPFVSQTRIRYLKEFYNLKQINIISLPIPTPTRWVIRRINYLLFPISILLLIILNKPDVIYVRDPGFLYLLAVLKSRLKFKLVVCEVHEIYYDRVSEDKKARQREREIKALQTADKVVAMTENLKNRLVELGIPPNKILVAHDGADLEIYKPFDKISARKELGIQSNKRVIVYTGHLYEWKGVYTLAEAMRYLNNEVLYMVGGLQEDINKLEEFIKSRHIPNVHVIGFVSPKVVPKYTAAADVVVLPNTSKLNVSKYYVSPLKLFEYMASNRPIVASDLPNLREILNTENAILVEPDNPQSLADGIKRVLDNGALANKIAEKAYNDVQRYTWDKRAEKVREFIES